MIEHRLGLQTSLSLSLLSRSDPIMDVPPSAPPPPTIYHHGPFKSSKVPIPGKAYARSKEFTLRVRTGAQTQPYHKHDQVLVHSSVWQPTNPKIKHLSTYWGPFPIAKVAYQYVKLELPRTLAYVPHVHISLIKKYREGGGGDDSGHPSPLRRCPIPVDAADNQYQASDLLGKRQKTVYGKPVIEYLVFWEGCPVSTASWVIEADIDLSMIQAFEARQRFPSP